MSPAPPDLRLLLPAVGAYAGALVGFSVPAWAWLPALAVAAVATGRHRCVLATVVLGATAATASSAALRESAQTHSLVAEAADAGAYVTLTLRVTSDPVQRSGRFGSFVVVRGTALSIQARAARLPTHAPVLVLGQDGWDSVELGAVVTVSGRLTPFDGHYAARLSAVRPPEVVAPPGRLLDAAAAVRHWIREGSARASPVARELVPSLVVGDDAGLPDEVVEEFRAAGLTHLTAVSGTNLTLVVGALVLLARWAGVRARGLLVVGLLGVAGFVLIARAEPSVIRAAAMGSVALLGLGSGARGRGVRALSLAVLVLLLFDPWLAHTAGFALSVAATAGILFLAPPLRDALSQWLPRWAAEAVSVPFAAQIACTPLVAALSGSVSLVAVLANVLVAPVVAPATVLGLVAGLAWPLSPGLGTAIGRLSGRCADWVVLVADRAAGLPAGSFTWPSGAVGVAALAAGCLALAHALPRFASHPRRSLLGAALLMVVMIRPPPDPGWPPPGWVMVACDVGQGDGLVLNAGQGVGVVVDTGPDPAAIDGCLRRLRVRSVPVVVLTHFHADHIDGLSGVLEGRDVRELQVTALRDPPWGADQARREAGSTPIRVPAYGEVRRLGDLRWQVIGPVGAETAPRALGEEGSAANDASLVLLVEVRGVRILLTGDAEPEAQQRLERSLASLRVDVLKVPHHGSRYQDGDFLAGLGARLAVVSAGAHNDYGHPSQATLDLLGRAGMQVRRTDLDGDVAVIVRGGELRVATRR